MALNIVFDQIKWNFNIITSRSVNMSLFVVGRQLFHDNRPGGTLTRILNADNRMDIVDALRFTCELLVEIMESYECYNSSTNNVRIKSQIATNIDFINHRTTEFIDGLRRLKSFDRYEHDCTFGLYIDELIEKACTALNMARELQAD